MIFITFICLYGAQLVFASRLFDLLRGRRRLKQLDDMRMFPDGGPATLRDIQENGAPHHRQAVHRLLQHLNQVGIGAILVNCTIV